jgi:hypothetical protein
MSRFRPKICTCAEAESRKSRSESAGAAIDLASASQLMPPPTTTRGTFRKPGPFSLAVAGSFLGDVLILTRPPSNELSSEGGGARSNHCRVRDLARWHSNKLSPAFIEGAKGLALERGTAATIIRRHSKCVPRSGEFPRRRSRAVRQGCGGAIDVAAAMSSSRKLVKKGERRRQSYPPGRL